MRIYKSQPQAFLCEIIVASLALLGVSLWGVKGLVLIALLVFRPFILEIEIKDVDKIYWIKHFNVIKLSLILTSLTIIAVYFISYFYNSFGANADFIMKMIFPYFMLIHGCAGTLFFKN